MLIMTDWYICTPPKFCLGFEGDNEVVALEISTDLTDEWDLKVDVEKSGQKNIIQLQRVGQVYSALLTASVLADDGQYLMQVRGTLGEQVRHSNIFYATVHDSITLNTTVPVVTVTGPDKSKISKVEGYNKSKISFTVDVAFAEYKVCVVPANSSTQDAGVLIPTDGGSINTSGADGDYPASTPIEVTITGTDLETASSGDNVKIVKVFVKTEAGIWSVA